ncbi:MAG: phage tail protein, partial [Deltaproteobacteria bacterium]|nr:phage tail protein [Deltaproteobacteria bacterium]
MPVRPTFPGVYIEEVPSGVRTIVGVATSVGAFIDYFARGPMNRAIQIFSFADLEREFGGLDAFSEASYAIQQFFLNGGTEAYVVRTGNSFATANIDLLDETPANSLHVTAGRLIKGVSVDDPGTWGNFVRLDVDYDTTDPNTLFNLTVSEVSSSGTQPVLRAETFRNLTMSAGVPNSAVDVVNEGSRIVQISSLGGGSPAQTGTVGTALSLTLGTIAVPFQCFAAINGGTQFPVNLGPIAPTTSQQARTFLEAALRAANPNDPRYTNATVQLIGDRLRVLTGRVGATPGSAFDPDTTIAFTENLGNTAAALGLLGVTPNVQQYSLGGTALGFQTTPIAGANGGNNGNRPNANDIIGVRANKTGLFALEDVDIFNILCIPR